MSVIGIAASMTAQPLERHLRSYLAGRGLAEPQIIVGPFNQLPQACRDPEMFFGRMPDIAVLLWRIEDLFPGSLGDQAALRDGLAELAAHIRVLRAHFKGTIIVATPPCPMGPGFDPRALTSDPRAAAGLRHAALLAAWLELLTGIEGVEILDLHGLALQAGLTQMQDARTWFLYRQPWRDAFWRQVARRLGRLVAMRTIAAKKCIVLDADNTLWGGIIGEDGLAGVSLSEDFPGSAYRAFQQSLRELRRRGILLAAASKNNPEDFYEMLDRHDAMVLRREDFAAFEIGWGSKAESLQRIAGALNIGLDSLVFIDDSAKEIGEIAGRLPEVTCLLVPEEITDLPALLADSDLFDQAAVTAEDLQRTEMMAAEGQRDAARGGLSEEEFKASLRLRMRVFRAGPQHLARIAQLINKTNQFNLTTVRRGADEVAALATSGTHAVFGMDLKDKYGDYGLVGAAVLEKRGDTCRIDTFLMSCRALGRDAETAFLRSLADFSAGWGCAAMAGSYIPTAKNGLAAGFLPGCGFSEESGEWRAKIASIVPAPTYIEIETGDPALKEKT